MFEVEIHGKNTKAFFSTDKYELFGPELNELEYINIHGGVGRIELFAGDNIIIFSEDGSESVNYTIGD